MDSSLIENRAYTTEDVMEHPHKYGMPTQAEFRANRAYWLKKWHGDAEERFSQADQGSVQLSHLIKEQKLYIMTRNKKIYACRTLEEVQRVCLNDGIEFHPNKFHTVGELEQTNEGKYILHTLFKAKDMDAPDTKSLITS